jgi:hypothetical protein
VVEVVLVVNLDGAVVWAAARGDQPVGGRGWLEPEGASTGVTPAGTGVDGAGVDGVVSGVGGAVEAIGRSAGGSGGAGVWLTVPVVVGAAALDGMGVGVHVPTVPSMETVAVEPKAPADATPAAMNPSSEMTSRAMIASRRIARRRTQTFTTRIPPVSVSQGATHRRADLTCSS